MCFPVTIQTSKQIEGQTIANRVAAKSADAIIKKAVAEGKYSELNQFMGVLNAGTHSAKDIIQSINPLGGLLSPKGK